MRISRIISLILAITVVSIFYVYQQTQILKLSYGKQNNLKARDEILDENMILRYNLMTLASARNLSEELETFDSNYEIPHFSQIVDLRRKYAEVELERVAARPRLERGRRRENIFLSFFGPKSQAEAQTR